MINDHPTKFLLILYEDGFCDRRVIKRVQTKSKNKFTRKLKLIPDRFYAFLKVSYSGGVWNDGYYQNKADLAMAYKAFVEK